MNPSQKYGSGSMAGHPLMRKNSRHERIAYFKAIDNIAIGRSIYFETGLHKKGK
jgi:hypothetical protein